ncbi:MAG: signal peptidase II, partial [Planctomycetota bacterium]|nr:signal peptidase II [Planctomycetota bacterium]
IDRIRLTYVVDFVDWYVKSYHWPTFNIADAGISGIRAAEGAREQSGDHDA